MNLHHVLPYCSDVNTSFCLGGSSSNDLCAVSVRAGD